MQAYLVASDIIDFEHPKVATFANTLAKNLTCKEDIAKKCFEYVRDKIKHTGDAGKGATTCKASEVLVQGHGWCYAKSHLLAALLRANGIPAALCYQRLSCNEYEEGIYCLHGLNAVWLEDCGWYRIDARGNKESVNAQFTPPKEQLAFELKANEYNVEGLFADTIPEVLEALTCNTTYEMMVANFPDIKG